MARIVLGVGGSIAAYKAADLASTLVQRGHEVEVVMTRMALRFLRPMTFSALTHRAVHTDENWGLGADPAAHLRATESAQALVVAPCTADLVGKFANGIADEILSTTYLGTRCPVLVAPAMNPRMWAHPRVVANVARLAADGVTVVEPGVGWTAERDVGRGRMAEPEEILAAVEAALPRARKKGKGR